MGENKPNGFHSPTKGALSPEGVSLEIASFVDEDPRGVYRVVIGSDSQAKRVDGKDEIDFVTAVIVYRLGRGGRFFWKKEKIYEKPILRKKIYTETMLSLAVAEDLVPQLRERIPAAHYDLEIHIDVGPIGPTRDMIKEVVGMVTGNGFVAKTKPESWGASSVADKYT